VLLTNAQLQKTTPDGAASYFCLREKDVREKADEEGSF
jgi:hypothetical protein